MRVLRSVVFTQTLLVAARETQLGPMQPCYTRYTCYRLSQSRSFELRALLLLLRLLWLAEWSAKL